jgi:CPA2 family monovalent cation:H+ antiporter-2
MTGVSLAAFLAALLGVGLLVVPRLVRGVVRLGRPETTVVTAVGICFAAALLALGFGYSVALGAFAAGSLVAESGHGHHIDELLAPLRDVFAALFFVAVGMLLDPAVVVEHWPAVLALTAVVLAGKPLAVAAGVFLTGNGLRDGVRAGMSLAQIGEFSFIIAGVGLAAGATRGYLYPVAVAVAALTTLTTPWMVRAGDGLARAVDRKLPPALQTFASLYGTWVERLRRPPEQAERRAARRLARRALADAALLAGALLAFALQLGRGAAAVGGTLSLGPRAARGVVLALALAAAVPLAGGLVRSTRRLAAALALRALPGPARGLDRAVAPRRALIAALHAAMLLAAAVPLVAVLQPFAPELPAVGVLAALAAALGAVVWHTAANLYGHTQAGPRSSPSRWRSTTARRGATTSSPGRWGASTTCSPASARPSRPASPPGARPWGARSASSTSAG